MIIICAWCKVDIEEIPPFDDTCISHGMCKGCAMMLRKKYKLSAPQGLWETKDNKDSIADKTPT